MLEKIPAALGAVLRPARAGEGRLVSRSEWFRSVPATLRVSSPAFEDGGRLDARFTEDGAGASPPFAWSNLPEGTRAIAVIVEDADSPTPLPLVHAIAWGPSDLGDHWAEGMLSGHGAHAGLLRMGKNSAFKTTYMPPDPPTGHGEHRYVIQVFALDGMPMFANPPGRRALLLAMRGRVLSYGCMTGIYERTAG